MKRIDIKELVENFPKERTLSNEALKQKIEERERDKDKYKQCWFIIIVHLLYTAIMHSTSLHHVQAATVQQSRVYGYTIYIRTPAVRHGAELI